MEAECLRLEAESELEWWEFVFVFWPDPSSTAWRHSHFVPTLHLPQPTEALVMTSSTQAHGPVELQLPQPAGSAETACCCCWSETEELEVDVVVDVSGGDII